MLILSRQRDEETVIIVPPSTEPTTIIHTTVNVRGNCVRHGWAAPRSTVIDRREVLEAKAREAATEAGGRSLTDER